MITQKHDPGHVVVDSFRFTETIHRVDYVDNCSGYAYEKAVSALAKEVARLAGADAEAILDRILDEVDPDWQVKLDDYTEELGF